MKLQGDIANEMILASAGSGKTFQLTNRYIAIMALQLKSGAPVQPERIIAVTFTRKAAGEFFSAILIKLATAATAATDPSFAKNLAGNRDDLLARSLVAMTPDDYRTLLRIFIQRMPRLFLGTLDSFYSNILRAFPAEFGLTTEFEVMDEYRTALAIDQVYEAVFSRRIGANEDDANQRIFLEAFRQATFGTEESKVIRSLDRFVTELHHHYLNAPDPNRWGDPTAIWTPETNRWIVEGIDPLKEFKRLRKTFEANPEQVNEKYWNEFEAEIEEHRPGTPFGKRTEYMLKQLLPAWTALENGHAEIKFNRKLHEFNAIACEAIRRILQWLIGGELRAKLNRTRGIWELLHFYESSYADRVRRQGQLTFQDIPLLLSGSDTDEASSLVLTQQSSGDGRLQIDYRLDARYDHWMLDEFQDTSFVQWKVIRNLIDEIVQDTSGEKSLFQVGDIKQAIYAWRGGDTRLFTDIFEHYNANEQRLIPRNLNVSYRSTQAILDPVNQIFGDNGALETLQLPAETINRWEWHDHTVAPNNTSKRGYTAWLNPATADGSKPDKDDISELVKAILEEVRPTERGISSAILVRGNERGRELIDYLRAHLDIPILSESDQYIATDNPVNLALLSLFQLAAHPADRFAWEHLKMTPYRHLIDAEDLAPATLARRITRSLFHGNFEATINQFVADLEASHVVPFDEFTQTRIEAFTLAARLFDETGSRDIDDFLTYVSRHTTKDADNENAVQVMTYHKSKGLTFDMVILPDLSSNSLTTARSNIGAKTNADREVEWVLDLPKKEIVEADLVLGDYLAEKQDEAAYEALCLYYVGLTRARYANYLISLHAPRSRSNNFVKLLENTIGGETEEIAIAETTANLRFQSDSSHSDRRWFENLPKEKTQAEKEPDRSPFTAHPRLRPKRRAPSDSDTAQLTAAEIFAPPTDGGRDFGSLIHQRYESIEWWSEDTLAHFEETLPSDCPTLPVLRNNLAQPEIQQALTRPSNYAEIWREKSYEVLLGNEWISGTFDRVTIVRDETGEAVEARILDFKTDAVLNEAEIAKKVESYRSQMELYRKALGILLSVPVDKITCSLLFTGRSQLIEISLR